MSDKESNESRETVAEIVADIRDRAENAMRNGERLVHNEAVANMLTFVADRIEAAAKRENAQPGDAAAMREALIGIRALIADEPDGTPMMDAMKATIDAALSAPARNCDVMSRSICTKHFSTIYEGNRDGLCDVQTEREKNIHLYYIKFNKWLFAPAAERKGDGDGSK